MYRIIKFLKKKGKRKMCVYRGMKDSIPAYKAWMTRDLNKLDLYDVEGQKKIFSKYRKKIKEYCECVGLPDESKTVIKKAKENIKMKIKSDGKFFKKEKDVKMVVADYKAVMTRMGVKEYNITVPSNVKSFRIILD